MRFLRIAVALHALTELTLASSFTPNPSDSLWVAVNAGSGYMAARMIQEGADVNGAADKSTPLYEAARLGRLEMVDLLLANGANTQIARPGRVTPIQAAAKHGHVDIVRRLAEHEEASADSLEKVMLFAAANGHSDVVEYLLERDRNLADARNTAGFTAFELTSEPFFTSAEMESPCALTMASARGHVGVVSALLQHGARLNYIALKAACISGHNEIINLFFDYHADIIEAVYAWRVDIVELLARRGTTRGFNEALLDHHVRHDFRLTKVLLENGADANYVKCYLGRPVGWTRLLYAVDDRRLDMIKLLLDHGADMRPAHMGITPLGLALARCYYEIVNIFIAAGSVKDVPISPQAEHNPDIMRQLLLGGAASTQVSDTVHRQLMLPISMVESAVSAIKASDAITAYNQAFPELSVLGYTFFESFLAFAFQARLKGADVLSDPQVRTHLYMHAKNDAQVAMLSSIITELAHLGCSDLNFFYSVAPFLAWADEDMLRHTETAFRFMAGSLGSNRDKKHRSANGAILNEMIQRSSQVGLRPVVKALFTIYHEESQIRRSLGGLRFQSTQELPESLLDLVVGQDNGLSNPGFKAKAMQKLTQAIRRLY